MTSSHHAPYVLGCTHATMAGTEGSDTAKVERIPQSRSQFGLEVCNSTSMKLESLVIVDQQRHGEYVPGPCTHRPSQS